MERKRRGRQRKGRVRSLGESAASRVRLIVWFFASRTQLGFLTSVSLSVALNRACNAIPTKVAIRIAG